MSDDQVFAGAAEFYDLLYADKDYAGEAAFVAKRLREQRPGARTLLDLGCGTGRHAAAFAALDFEILGIDRSAAMLERAPQIDGVAYAQGDVTSYDAGRTFDAVVSLFHVASYQVTEEALDAMFKTVRRHLAGDGVALFDFWYGPAVLADPPVAREKRLESGNLVLSRRATPEHQLDASRVDVHYTFVAEDGDAGTVREFEETHAMRYLFEDELTALLEAAGLRTVDVGNWMTDGPPRLESWNAWMSAVAV